MKKVLSFALLLCGLAWANVQGQVGFIYNGQNYMDGSNVTITLPASAHQVTQLKLKNFGEEAVTRLVLTVAAVDVNGIEAWGVCAGGRCIPSLTTQQFNLAAGEVDTSFAIDIDINSSMESPYGVYTISVTNGSTTCNVTVRLEASTVGIGSVAASTPAVAFPNPAQGAFSIRYELNEPATLAIVDMQGRTVKALKVNGTGTAKVEDLPAGIYAYGILGSNSMKKLVVK